MEKQGQNAHPAIVILGAGPTGLGAAYRLKELGHSRFVMTEKSPYLGGLASSHVDESGFTWDIGGHVMFSHYPYYDSVFQQLMGEEFSLINREAWVRLLDRWVPYPFQNNLRHLPPQAAYDCLAGLLKAQNAAGGVHAGIASARNFEEFNHAVFGEGICRHFMTPYNTKVWGHPPAMMNKAWVGQRVAIIDADRALRNYVLGADDFGWGPNNRFKYPLKGGTGEFYRRFGPILEGHVHLRRQAAWVDPHARRVGYTDGSTEPYDHLLSTVPLDLLVTRMLRGDVPDAVRDAASRLRRASGHMVGVGLRRDGGTPSTKAWMYFPEDNCPFYRVTYLSNYSPHMTPDKDRYYSLLCETSVTEFRPRDASRIVQDTVQGLINASLLTERDQDDIVTTWHYFADHSYPVPSVDRDELLSVVIPWLERHRIYSRGRFGMWKYEVANTDHSLMQGVELVNRLLLGEPEKTIGLTYAATDSGEASITHHRSTFAGSGERRTAPVPRG